MHNLVPINEIGKLKRYIVDCKFITESKILKWFCKRDKIFQCRFRDIHEFWHCRYAPSKSITMYLFITIFDLFNTNTHDQKKSFYNNDNIIWDMLLFKKSLTAYHYRPKKNKKIIPKFFFCLYNIICICLCDSYNMQLFS